MPYYHWSPNKFKYFVPNYQGIHIASSLLTCYDLTVNRRLDFNTGHVYEVDLVDLHPAHFKIDTMDWGLWDVLNLLLGKLGLSKIRGATEGEVYDDEDEMLTNWKENVSPDVVDIPAEKILPYKDWILDSIDEAWEIKHLPKDNPRKIGSFKYLKQIIRAMGYDSISYTNYGENPYGDICYILFNPNQVKSSKYLGLGSEVRDLIPFKESYRLTEATRQQLAIQSRSAGAYKDQSFGKNRYERRNRSKIATSVKQYNKIDMNQLFKQDRLEVAIPVIGETDNYEVTVRIDGVIAEMAKNIKNNKYKLEFRTVIQSLTKVFNTKDVYINCTCPDHRFNFSHWNIMHNCSTLDTAHDPGAGKGIANPNDDKGRGCKHSLLILSNGDWMMKVASVINNYIHYMSEKMQKPFLKLIFPKLYGCDANEMAKLDILGKEEVEETLQTNSSFIDAINEYGKNRGKIKKGSNKNTASTVQYEPEEENTYDNDNQKNLEKAEKETAEANEKARKEAEEREAELEAERQAKIEAAAKEDETSDEDELTD